MVISDIRTRVLARINRIGDTTLSDPITYALEQVQDDITQDVNIPELMTLDITSLTTAAATQTYSLPTDFGKMICIWNNLNFEYELMRITPSEYKDYLGDVNSDTETYPHFYDIMDYSTTLKRIHLFGFPAAGAAAYVIPFVYLRRVAYLSDANTENILSKFYPQAFIEGGMYYMYRDVVHPNEPEKIAFRRGEYDKQINLMKKAMSTPNRIPKIKPKRLIPSTTKLYTVQTTGY